MTSGLVRLDRSADRWVGTFPGLGRVAVESDGHCTVEVASDAPAGADDTLRWGWGEPLGWLRAGLQLAAASAMVDAATGRALLITGIGERQTRLMLALRERGWARLTDGLAGLAIGSPIVAHSRRGPWIASARSLRQAGEPAEPVRPGATAAVVSGATWTEPAAVHGRVHLRGRRSGSSELHEVRGHDRVRPELALLSPWSLGERAEPAAQLAADMAVHHVPCVRLDSTERHSIDGEAIDSLLAWWAGL